MTRFVLDTDVIIALEQVGSGLAARGELPVIVTDVVWDELEAPGDDRARAQNFARAIAGKVTVLQADSPEAATLVALQEAPRIEGAGEHSVIAYCHHHPESVAVLQDKAALRRAVEELRGRVLSFHGLVGELVERGHVTWAEARTMSTKYRRQFNHARVPIWWVEGSDQGRGEAAILGVSPGETRHSCRRRRRPAEHRASSAYTRFKAPPSSLLGWRLAWETAWPA